MECGHKIRIKVVPKDVNQSIYYMLVPCGKCPICLSKKRQKWLVRLTSEFKFAWSVFFITLTYDDAHMPYKDGMQTLSKRDVQLFMKRLRKATSGYKLKYYLCSEYGGHTMRPHYHMMLYFYKGRGAKSFPRDELDAFHLHYNVISKCWDKGISDVRDANTATANYCLKDTLKLENDVINGTSLTKTFRLISKGLGERDAQEKAKTGYKFTYVVQDGKKVAIPRYQREKMFELMDADDVIRMKQEIDKGMVKQNIQVYNRRNKYTAKDFKNEQENRIAKENSIVHRAKKNCKI